MDGRARLPAREGFVEFLRAQRERRHALIINDPQPVASTDDIWATTSQFAIIGIFVLLLVAAFDIARPVLLPIMAALHRRDDVWPDHQACQDSMACRLG